MKLLLSQRLSQITDPTLRSHVMRATHGAFMDVLAQIMSDEPDDAQALSQGSAVGRAIRELESIDPTLANAVPTPARQRVEYITPQQFQALSQQTQ